MKNQVEVEISNSLHQEFKKIINLEPKKRLDFNNLARGIDYDDLIMDKILTKDYILKTDEFMDFIEKKEIATNIEININSIPNEDLNALIEEFYEDELYQDLKDNFQMPLKEDIQNLIQIDINENQIDSS